MIFTTRRKLLAALPVLSLGYTGLAFGQKVWPERPVTLIVGYGPGGPADAYARLLADALTKTSGQPCIVQNKPGAGGAIALRAVASSAPDGYTLATTSPLLAGPIFRKNPLFDPDKDFTPMAILMNGQEFVLAIPDALPIRSVDELVKYSKANPGKLNQSAGSNLSEFLGGLLKQQTGGDWVAVRYQGSAAALQATLSNQIQLHFDLFGSVRSHLGPGRLRLLATTAPKRKPHAPDVPTFDELGLPAMTHETQSTVVVGPAGIPSDLQVAVNAAIRRAMATPSVVERLKVDNLRPFDGSVEAVHAITAREKAFWAKAAKAANYQPE